jgi:hypothetical protein
MADIRNKCFSTDFVPIKLVIRQLDHRQLHHQHVGEVIFHEHDNSCFASCIWRWRECGVAGHAELPGPLRDLALPDGGDVRACGRKEVDQGQLPAPGEQPACVPCQELHGVLALVFLLVGDLPADVAPLLRVVVDLPGVVGHISLDVASIPADVGNIRWEVLTYLRRRSLISIICTCWDSYRVKSLSTAWRRSRSSSVAGCCASGSGRGGGGGSGSGGEAT